MKNLLIISLLILFLSLSLSKTIVFINYQLNIEFIKKELCENKDKPQMKCNGKCYLNKQVKKAEPNPKHLPESLKQKDELKIIGNRELDGIIYEKDLVHIFFIYNQNILSFLYKSIFIPPPNFI